jgi:hypothetical protein
LGARVALTTKPMSETVRGHFPAAAVEQHHDDRRSALLPIKPLEECVLCAKGLGLASGERGTTSKVKRD